MSDRRMTTIKDEPRTEVVISEEHTDEFIEMVDNPKFNPKMAQLMKEAKETFPEEEEEVK